MIAFDLPSNCITVGYVCTPSCVMHSSVKSLGLPDSYPVGGYALPEGMFLHALS